MSFVQASSCQENPIGDIFKLGQHKTWNSRKNQMFYIIYVMVLMFWTGPCVPNFRSPCGWWIKLEFGLPSRIAQAAFEPLTSTFSSGPLTNWTIMFPLNELLHVKMIWEMTSFNFRFQRWLTKWHSILNIAQWKIGQDSVFESSIARRGWKISDGVNQMNKFCLLDGHAQFPTLVGALNFFRQFAKIVLMK